MSMRNFKLNITQMPNYLDGYFELFEIKTSKGVYPEEYLYETGLEFPFEYVSIGDKLMFEADAREIELTHKIRIPQTKSISSMNVLRIGDDFHQVYNTYHFNNKDGFEQTNITLLKYKQDLDIRGEYDVD